MEHQTNQRYLLLQKLARYEGAYKRALQFASFNMVGAVPNINSPFYELAKLYKNKIKQIRNEIRSS